MGSWNFNFKITLRYISKIETINKAKEVNVVKVNEELIIDLILFVNFVLKLSTESLIFKAYWIPN